MSATPQTSAVTRDSNSVPMPQYWNPSTLEFEALEGQNGTIYVAKPLDPTGAFAFTLLYNSASLENNNVIKNVAGTLYKVFVTSTASSGGPYYFMLFNSTTEPSNSTVSLIAYQITNGSTIPIDLGAGGMFFSTGIYYCISTTVPTLTTTANNLFAVSALGA